MTSANRIGMLALGGIAGALVIASGLGALNYPGSTAVFAGFSLIYLALLASIAPRPRTYVYAFFAGLLFLGFWLKTVALFGWGIQLIEPVGDFSYAPAAWDTALILAAAGALGALAARTAHILLFRKGWPRNAVDAPPGVPAGYAKWRQWVWIVTLALIVGINLLNLRFSFYQIGVNPKLVLPLRLNVPVAWLINVGFALWLSTLIGWDLRIGKGFIGGSLAVLFEALLSSVTAQSRLFFLLHAAPYVLACAETWRSLGKLVNKRAIVVLAACFSVFLLASIATISWLRFQEYFVVPTLPRDLSASEYYDRVTARNFSRLFVHRWVGLEGVLTAAALPDRGYRPLRDAVTDDARLGARALFQRAAKVPYQSNSPEQFTFLTNAGPVALLAFSGSTAVTFAGIALLVLILVATEHAARRWTGNPFFVAVAAAALANVASQMTFPYLSLIFLLQLWTAIAFVSLLQRLKLGSGAVRP